MKTEFTKRTLEGTYNREVVGGSVGRGLLQAFCFFMAERPKGGKFMDTNTVAVRMVEELSKRGLEIYDTHLNGLIDGVQIIDLVERGIIGLSKEHAEKMAGALDVTVEELTNPEIPLEA